MAGTPDQSGGTTEAGGTLTETKTKITQTARDAASKVKDAASSTAARAKDEAQRFAAEKKESAASRIGSYSSAIHETARSLEEKDPNIAWFTHRAADRLQGVADYVRNRDFSLLRHDCEDIARRHPGAFFGGMFLAGLLVGNIVKASRRKADQGSEYGDESASDWQRGEVMQEPEMTEAERSAAGI
jgi:hypothetical protein